MTKWILAIIMIIVIATGSFYGGIKYSTPSNIPDTTTYTIAKAKIETTYVKTVEKIYIKGKDKERVDSFYVVDTSKLVKLRNDTTKLKNRFDSTFPIAKVDSNTLVGYSQIYGTLVINSKFIRDSAKLKISDSQLTICSTGLKSLKLQGVALADTAKKITITQYNKGYSDGSTKGFKNTITYSVIAFIIGAGVSYGVTH